GARDDRVDAHILADRGDDPPLEQLREVVVPGRDERRPEPRAAVAVTLQVRPDVERDERDLVVADADVELALDLARDEPRELVRERVRRLDRAREGVRALDPVPRARDEIPDVEREPQEEVLIVELDEELLLRALGDAPQHLEVVAPDLGVE